MVELILLFVALLCFIAEAMGLASRTDSTGARRVNLNLIAAGLACLTAALIIPLADQFV